MKTYDISGVSDRGREWIQDVLTPPHNGTPDCLRGCDVHHLSEQQRDKLVSWLKEDDGLGEDELAFSRSVADEVAALVPHEVLPELNQHLAQALMLAKDLLEQNKGKGVVEMLAKWAVRDIQVARGRIETMTSLQQNCGKP